MQAEVDPAAHLTCCQSITTGHPNTLMNLSIRGAATRSEGINTAVGRSLTKEGIPIPLNLHQIILMLMQLL